MPGPPGLASPGLDIYVQERADGAKRSRHFGLGGFGAVKCRTTWARRVVRLIGTARNWLMVEIGAGNPLIHRIAAVFSGQKRPAYPPAESGDFSTFYTHIIYMYTSIMFFFLGYEKARAWARARGFRPRTQGSGSGLKNLKPEPPQAEPEPGHSGRAGPATSLTRESLHVDSLLLRISTVDRGSHPLTQYLWSWKVTDHGVTRSMALMIAITNDTGTNHPTRRRGSDRCDSILKEEDDESQARPTTARVDDLRTSEEQQALDGIWLEVCAPRAMATRMSWIGKLAVRTDGGCESTRDSPEGQGLLWRQASWTGGLLQVERERRAGEMGAKGKKNWAEFEFLDHLRSACSDVDAINS
ncbi:hypothetical protein DFH09DRAFT_1286918 [Mycena vulgaris]|nr:hypothetical protein DFH09DRAFT_1286918 [Mycena vulgaris]